MRMGKPRGVFRKNWYSANTASVFLSINWNKIESLFNQTYGKKKLGKAR